MNLCLDTNVVIEIFRDRQPQYRRCLDDAERNGHKIQLSSLVLHELLFGARISRKPERELNLIERFVGRASVWPWSAEDALSAADVRADLVARGWALVTSNIKDFVRVPELRIIDWSDPAGACEINSDEWMLAHPRRPPKETK